MTEWGNDAMAKPVTAILAVDPLLVDLVPPGGAHFNFGENSQAAPLLFAALLVALPLGLWFSVSQRRQRKRMTHRPRNPTLAETGGLPPPRSSGAPPHP